MNKIFIGIGLLAALGIGYYFISYDRGTESVETTLGDGGYLGFIHQVGNDSLEFDDALWLSGIAGEEAAIATGHCTEETRAECLPNDYFILNQVERDERIPLDQNVLILMQTWEAGEMGIREREISLDDFRMLINDSEASWSRLPYTVTVENGKIVQIVEVYIP